MACVDTAHRGLVAKTLFDTATATTLSGGDLILTGSEIQREVRGGRIFVDPFDERDINPNSLNYHLGEKVKVSRPMSIDARKTATWREIDIPVDGLVFRPGRVYLGSTSEVIGSDCFVPSLIGRSSLGRLGVFLQISADLGNLGACHRWTLEIVVSQPVRLYAGMRCGQVTFWEPSGDVDLYHGHMAQHSEPHEAIRAAFMPWPSDHRDDA